MKNILTYTTSFKFVSEPIQTAARGRNDFMLKNMTKERMIYMMNDEELSNLKFYDYKSEMVDELEDMIKNSDIDFTGKNRGEAFEELQDLAFDRDLTGNRTGSYFCNELKAERALLGNYDLVQDAVDDFSTESIDSSDLLNGEHLDILIREHLLPDVIDEVLDNHNLAPF